MDCGLRSISNNETTFIRIVGYMGMKLLGRLVIIVVLVVMNGWRRLKAAVNGLFTREPRTRTPIVRVHRGSAGERITRDCSQLTG